VLLLDHPWRSNTLVHAVWPLIAGLLKRDPAAQGISHCGFGSGDPAWDVDLPVPSATAVAAETGLAQESVERLQEQLAVLQLVLDAKQPKGLTLGELARARA